MNTPREMVAKLQRLANQIDEKSRELTKLHKRHKMASQGNMKFVNGRVNKDTYTNANYMRNVHNAMRIVYNERKPLMNNYNQSAKKYREFLGLPTTGNGYVRGPTYQWNWQKKNQVNFSRAKRGPTPNVTNLYIKYQPFGATSSRGGGGGAARVSLGASYYKFHPNNQLMNTILKRNKAGKIISKTLLARIYRPSNKNKGNEGGAMFKKALASFHRT